MEKSKTREKLKEMFLESLKEDMIPWHQGWQKFHTMNGKTKHLYKGVNKMLLSYISEERGYDDPRFYTYNQVAELGLKLKDAKGMGIPVEYWSLYDIELRKNISIEEYEKFYAEDPDLRNNVRWIARNYVVFNAKHVDGLAPLEQNLNNDVRIPQVQTIIDNLIQEMKVGYFESFYCNTPHYDPITDQVGMPIYQKFHSSADYYASLLHELSHSTGHYSRLSRKITNDYGSLEYAKEELRAEISSTFVCAELNLDSSIMNENHKAYIQSWITIIEEQENELFKAIKDAEEISDYLYKIGNFEEIINSETITDTENIYSANNPHKLSLDDYLSEKNVEFRINDYVDDKIRGNRSLSTVQGTRRFHDEINKANLDYHEQREKAIQEYKKLIAEGRIIEKTKLELELEKANGHPDLEATHAARRILAKRGYCWKTAEDLETKYVNMARGIKINIELGNGDDQNFLTDIKKIEKDISEYISKIEECPDITISLSLKNEHYEMNLNDLKMDRQKDFDLLEAIKDNSVFEKIGETIENLSADQLIEEIELPLFKI